MALPTGLIVERPYIIMEQYLNNLYASVGFMAGHILGVWQSVPEKPDVGDYVYFRINDAIQVKYNAVTYYLLEDNKILFSFSVS